MPQIKRQTLTKLIVEGAKPRASAYRLWDAKVPGLALRVLPSGRSTYEVHWARHKAMNIGVNGVMTLEGARVAARRVLGEVDEHGAPLEVLGGGKKQASTLGEYIRDHYAPHVEAVNKAGAATVAAINVQFGHLYDRPLASIGKADWDKFKVSRLNEGLHPNTVNRDLDRLKAALFQAVEWGMLTENPLRGVQRIKRGLEPRVRYLSSDEEARLRAALAARDTKARVDRESGNRWRKERGIDPLPKIQGYADSLTPVVVLALNTGMRKGELATLEWSGVNLDAALLTVRAGYAKSGEARHIPLNSEAMAVLRGLRASKKGGGAIFGGKSFTKAWKGVLADAGITDFRFHDLRHTFASNLVMADVPLNTVRELMGHSEIEMTIRYAHLAPSHKSAAVAKLVKVKKKSAKK